MKKGKIIKVIMRIVIISTFISIVTDGIGSNNSILADTAQSKSLKKLPENSVDATDVNVFGTNALVPNSDVNQSNQLGAIVTKTISLGKS